MIAQTLAGHVALVQWRRRNLGFATRQSERFDNEAVPTLEVGHEP